MDTELLASITAALTGLVGGATGAAGVAGWEALAGFVHKHFGRRSREVRALQSVKEAGGIARLAELLVARSDDDAEFRRALDAILGQLESKASEHQNTVTGDVWGTVIQARDIKSIMLGQSRPVDE